MEIPECFSVGGYFQVTFPFDACVCHTLYGNAPPLILDMGSTCDDVFTFRP